MGRREEGGQRQEVRSGSDVRSDVNISGLLPVVLSLGFSPSLSQQGALRAAISASAGLNVICPDKNRNRAEIREVGRQLSQ